MTDLDKALRKQARGIAAFVRDAATKHDALEVGAGAEAAALHVACAAALRKKAAEIEEFYVG